ncbi:MAG: alpha/beta hydrolase [Leptolyngbya sp.]|nr:alpha/beta hydrolase [Leptolyngbya sp.]
MAAPFRNGRIRLSSGTLFWREVGQGPTVVFLHGNWSDSSQWQPLMAALADQCHCLAPDLLGFGESSRSRRLPYAITLEVDCLAEFLAAVRSPAVVLVAEEVGAWVATRYALQYPDRVRGLLVLNPEGVTPPGVTGRWQPYAWLARRWSVRYQLLQLVRPLVALLGGRRWLQRVQRRRQVLLDYTATCRLLFQGRRAERQGELMDEALPGLMPPVWVMQPEGCPAIAQALNQTYASRVGQGTPKPLELDAASLSADPTALKNPLLAFITALHAR